MIHPIVFRSIPMDLRLEDLTTSSRKSAATTWRVETSARDTLTTANMLSYPASCHNKIK